MACPVDVELKIKFSNTRASRLILKVTSYRCRHVIR